jgi:hypothetical protein
MTAGDIPLAGVVAQPVTHRDESDSRTPTRRLLDHLADLPRIDTGWADQHAEMKRAEIEAQSDEPSE